MLIKYSENVFKLLLKHSFLSYTNTGISLSCPTVLNYKQCYYFSVVLNVHPINLVTL